MNIFRWAYTTRNCMQEFWCEEGWADNTWWAYNTYSTVEADTRTHARAHTHTHTHTHKQTNRQTDRQTDPEGQVAEISKEASTPSGKLGVRAIVLVRRCRQRIDCKTLSLKGAYNVCSCESVCVLACVCAHEWVCAHTSISCLKTSTIFWDWSASSAATARCLRPINSARSWYTDRTLP